MENKKPISPQQQLWKETSVVQQQKLAPLLRIVKPRYQEDLCLGLVAYIRFDIYRPFANPVMQCLYEQCIDIVLIP